MKQIQKQTMKELIKFALEMPAENLTQYGTLFLTGEVPERMTRGELIALQLVDRASFGDLDAIKELRNWIQEDPKIPQAAGGTTYYQFLISLSGKTPEAIPVETLTGLKSIADKIDSRAKIAGPSILSDLT